jgi:hypothetical protein
MPPLDCAGVEAITSEYLGDARPEASLVEYVALLADGTPLGAPRGAGRPARRGALKPHWGSWQFGSRRGRARVAPATSPLLERRVEQRAATRRVLEAAAVLGGGSSWSASARSRGHPADLVFAVNEGAQAGLVELGATARRAQARDRPRGGAERSLGERSPRLHQRAAEVLGSEDAGDRETLFGARGTPASGRPERDPRRLYEVARAAAAQAAASLDSRPRSISTRWWR